MSVFFIEQDRFEVTPETTASALVFAHNEAADALGEKSVNRFSDKESAMRRTLAMFAKAVAAGKATPDAPAKADEPAKAEKAPKVKAVRQMHFTFPVDAAGIKPVKQDGSLRASCVSLLIGDGATLAEVVKLVEEFDARRGKAVGNVERRAYELVRIMHYYLGYGMKHNAETGKIRLVTK